MALVSWFWQRYYEIPLLDFALGVMVFAYAGLLGVYGAALWTNRGDEKTVRCALIAGFVTVFLLQSYITKPLFDFEVKFALQIIIGTIVSFVVMMSGREK
jgi:Na+/proline symporter